MLITLPRAVLFSTMASVAPRNMSGYGFRGKTVSGAYWGSAREQLREMVRQENSWSGGLLRKKLLPSLGFGISVTQRGRAGPDVQVGIRSLPSHLLASGQSTSQERCGQRAQILQSLPEGLAHFCHLPLTLPSLGRPVFLGFTSSSRPLCGPGSLPCIAYSCRGDWVFNPTVRSEK